MRTIKKEKKNIIIFYTAVLSISLAFELLYMYSSNFIWVGFLSWTPAVTGIICAKLFYPGERILGIRNKVRLVYLVLGLILPFMMIVPSSMISWGIVGDPTDRSGLSAYLFLSQLFYLLLAPGEEIGWRGYAYPILERVYGPVKAVIINGSLWAVWHMALILGGEYSFHTNLYYGIISIIVGCILESIIYCWLRSASESVIPCIIFHSVYNLLSIEFLELITTKDETYYLAGENGIITFLFTTATAVVLISSRKSRKQG